MKSVFSKVPGCKLCACIRVLSTVIIFPKNFQKLFIKVIFWNTSGQVVLLFSQISFSMVLQDSTGFLLCLLFIFAQLLTFPFILVKTTLLLDHFLLIQTEKILVILSKCYDAVQYKTPHFISSIKESQLAAGKLKESFVAYTCEEVKLQSMHNQYNISHTIRKPTFTSKIA